MENPIVYETVFAYHRKLSRKVICPHCRGEGIIEHRRFCGHSEGWTFDTLICGVCDGKGRLHKTIELTYKKLDN